MTLPEKFYQEFDADPTEGEGVRLDSGQDVEEKEDEQETAAEPAVEDVAEGQEEGPGEVSESDQEIQADGQAEKIRAVDFAKQAGWDLEEFYRDVTVPTDTGEVSLSEVVDGFKDLRSENESLRQERQQLQEKAAASGVPMQQYSVEAQDLFSRAKYLQEQYENTQWGKLDPAEAANMRFEYQDAINKLTQQGHLKQAEHEQKAKEAIAKYRIEVDTQVGRLIPAWRNPRVKQEQFAAVSSMLSSEYGFDEAAIAQAALDPRAQHILHDLWELKQRDAQIKAGVKKIKKVPKHLTSASRREAGKRQIADVGKAIRAAKGRKEKMDLIMNAEFDRSNL